MLVQDFRLDSVYAPRPVYFDRADLPQGKPAVLFAPPEAIEAARIDFGNYHLGELIYENHQAVTDTYRTPGRQSAIGPLQVVRLDPIN